MNGFDEFARDMDRIRGDFDKEIPLIMDAVGAELLAETRKEIVRQQLVDTRDMLNSFSLGNSFNVFEKRKGGYEVEAGTTNPYAMFVNEGTGRQDASHLSSRRTSSTSRSRCPSSTCRSAFKRKSMRSSSAG